MKIRSTVLLILLSTSISFGNSLTADSISSAKKNHALDLSIIPFQFFLRSSGLSLKYPFKRFTLDYVPSFTYPTFFTSSLESNYDWFFYKGINNCIVFYPNINQKWNLGIMIGFKYWWIKNKIIPVNGIYLPDDKSYYERKSSTIYGPVIGIQIEKKLTKNKFVKSFHFDFTFTIFTGDLIRYEAYGRSAPAFGINPYPIEERVLYFIPNISLGWKFGRNRNAINASSNEEPFRY